MNQAFDRAGVSDRVTPESHATQLARACEAGDASEEERLLLNPPSQHIGPAAKHRWEDRSSGAPELKPDRYAAYEAASASAREARSAHARDAAEAAEARSKVEALDAEIAAPEAEQRRAEAAARRRKEAAAARREAERRQTEAKRDEERKARQNGPRPPAGRRGAVPPQTWRTSIRSGTWTATRRRAGFALLLVMYACGGSPKAPRPRRAPRSPG